MAISEENKHEIKTQVKSAVKKQWSLAKTENILEVALDLSPISCLHQRFLKHYYFEECIQSIKSSVQSIIENTNRSSSPEEITALVDKIQNSQTLENLPDKIKELTETYELLINNKNDLHDAAQQNLLKSLQQFVAEIANVDSFNPQVVPASSQVDLSGHLKDLKELYLHPKAAFLIPSMTFWNEINATSPLWEAFKKNSDLGKKFDEEFQQLVVSLNSPIFLPVPSEQLTLARNELLMELTLPLRCEVKVVNNKTTLVVTKPILLLSECLPEIEDLMSSNGTIRDMHLISGEVIYINVNLKNDKWHGISILLASKRVECLCENLEWNLSGGNGTNAPSERAPDSTSDAVNGSPGQDGTPGENGGNCIFVTDNSIRMNFLRVISSGGKGGTGQPGGDGHKGKPGEKPAEISLEMLKSEFPSPAKIINNPGNTNLTSIVNNIRTRLDNRGENEQEQVAITGPNWYLAGDTIDRMKIEFGYYSEGMIKQTYCLIKGATSIRGNLGSHGGKGGASAAGGFPGILKGYNWSGVESTWNGNPPKLTASPGTPGQSVLNGKNGDRGDTYPNGYDVGFIDKANWSPVYYGPGSYEMASGKKNPDGNTVWCPKFKCERSFQEVTRPNVQVEKHEQEEQTKVKAIKMATHQNPISITQILDMYKSHHLENLQDEVHTVNVIQQYVPPQQYLNTEESPEPRFDVPASDETPNIICQERFKALEAIKAKRYVNEAMSRVTTEPRYVALPTSAGPSESNDSVFHAIFGTKNSQGVYEAVKGKRIDVCQTLKGFVGEFQGNASLQKHLKESLTNYFEDKSDRISSSSGDSQPFRIKTENLDNVAADYNNASPELPFGDHMWDNNVYKSNQVIEEYIDFLATEKIPWLRSDLRLLATAFKTNLKIYKGYENHSLDNMSSCYLGEEVGEESEEMFENTWRVSINGSYQYSHVTEKLITDRSNVNAKIVSIVSQVYRLNTIESLHQFVSDGNPPDSNLEEFYGEQHIHMVKAMCGREESLEKRSKLETRFLSWPPLLLTIFYDKVQTCVDEDKSLIQSASSKISELINSNRTDLCEDIRPSVIWTVATCPVEQWGKELLLTSAELYFQNVKFSDIEIWREKLIPMPIKLIVAIGKVVSPNTACFFGTRDKVEFGKFLDTISKQTVNDDMDYSKLTKVVRHQWVSQLRKRYLESRLAKLPNVEWNLTNKKSQALYYLYSLYNEKPALVDELIEALMEVLSQLSPESKIISIRSILSSFNSGKYDLTHENITLLKTIKNLDHWEQAMQSRSTVGQGQIPKPREYKLLLEMIEANPNNSLTDGDLQKINVLITALKSVPAPENLKSNFKDEMARWRQEFSEKIQSAQQNTEDEKMNLQLEALTRFNFVIEHFYQFKLKGTQTVSILATLLLGCQDKNLLSQIATGEGKTLIVLAVAVIRGLFGERTDIVTSSVGLARRDAKDYRDIYAAFGLTVGDVTQANEEKRIIAYTCTVVVGDIASYQRDFLMDTFYNKKIRGKRPMQNIIVDEVDSMFLDKATAFLYLSHQPPGLDALEHILVYVWKTVVDAVNSGEIFTLEEMRENLINLIYPRITQSDLEKCVESGVSDLHKWLVENKIIDNRGYVRLVTGENVIQNLQAKEFPKPFDLRKKQIIYLLQTKVDQIEEVVPVPNHLKKRFVLDHLSKWIENAFISTRLEEGKEYVVDVDHENVTLDKYSKITILDQGTGEDLKNSQWNEALHQYLQFLHGCRLSPVSLKAVFTSNISYFKQYSRIFGLTGTMGTEADRHFLQSSYNVEFLSMPLALPKRFEEDDPIVCKDEAEWCKRIYEDVLDKAQRRKRSVLIICGSVNEAEIIYGYFSQKRLRLSIHLYRRDYEKFSVADNGHCLAQETIIIATDLAGRGTDIKLSPELKTAGGLHTIFAYLSDNLRGEQQGMGRAGRKGDPGSGILIFVDKLSKNLSSLSEITDAVDLKILRDEQETARVADIQTYHNAVIVPEEKMFEKFSTKFKKVHEALDTAYSSMFGDNSKENKSMDNLLEGNIQEMKELVLDSMINSWAYYLDRYSTFLTNNYENMQTDPSADDTKEIEWKDKFAKMIQPYDDLVNLSNNTTPYGNLFSPMEKKILDLISKTDPVSTVKMAKCLMRRGEFKLSNSLSRRAQYYTTAEIYLNEVIQNEPQHCIPAMYYKLYCRIKLGDDWKTLQSLCNNLIFKIDSYIQRQSMLLATVNQVRQSLNHNVREGAYDIQKQNMVHVLQLFKGSIEDAIDKEVMTPNDFASVCGSAQVAQHAIDFLVEEKSLCGTFELVPLAEHGDLVNNLAKDFCMKKTDAETLLGKFKGQSSINMSWQKDAKRRANFPSRSDFFREITPCFDGGPEEFIVIQPRSENERNLSNDFKPWLQTKENIHWISKRGSDISSSKLKVIIGKKLDNKSRQDYVNLRKSGHLCYETVGRLDIAKLKTHQLTKHHRVNCETFKIINSVSETESQQIFNNLVSSKVIDANSGELLTGDWTNLKLDSELLVYETDIKQILHATCRYKFELLLLLHRVETGESSSPELNENHPYQELRLTLPSAPFKEFFRSAIQNKLVKGTRPNVDHLLKVDLLKKPKQGVKFAKEVYDECSPTLDDLTNNPANIVTKIYDKIQNDEKAEVKVFMTKENLVKLFPENSSETQINSLWDELVVRGWITIEGEVKSDTDVQRAEDLSETFRHYQSPLNSFRTWLLYKKNKGFVEDLVKICKNNIGKLRTLTTPDAALESLRIAVSRTPWGKKNFGEELYLFELNGFSDIFESKEMWYSWKMIGSATLVLVVGLAQIGIGVFIQLYTTGAGTFVARGFIQEGINDVVTSLMAFGSGYFSWQDWADNKWTSVAMTAATMFIGGVNAKGVGHSKFGQKLLGNVKISGSDLYNAFANQSKKGMNPVTKAVLRSCAYQVGKGVTIAGSTMATKVMYEATIKKISDKVFGDMYAQIDTTIQQHQILETASQLALKFGIDDAEQKLDQCMFRVERNSTRDREAVRFLSGVGKIVQNGLNAATERKQLAGLPTSTTDSPATAVSTVLSVINTGTMIQKAMSDMNITVSKNLDHFQEEIKSEIRIKEMHPERDEEGNIISPPVVTETERQEFLVRFQEKVGNHIKKKLGDVVQYEVFQPIIYKVVHTLSVKARRTIKEKLTAKKESQNLNESKKIIKNNNVAAEGNSEPNANLSNNPDLRKLSMESRDPKVIGHIVESGGPIGMEGLVAAANECNHTICVTSDDPNMNMTLNPIGNGDFSPSAKVLQIHYCCKNKTFESISSKKSQENSSEPQQSTSSAASTSQPTSPELIGAKTCPLEAINHELKNVSPATQSIERKQIARRIQKDPYVQHFIKSGWHHSYALIGTPVATNSTLGQPVLGEDKRSTEIEIKNEKKAASENKEYVNTLTFPKHLTPIKNINDATVETPQTKSWVKTLYLKSKDTIKSVYHEGDISFGMFSDKTLYHHDVVDGLKPALGSQQEHVELSGAPTDVQIDPELYQRIENISGKYISVHCAQNPTVKFIVRTNFQCGLEKVSQDVILSYTLNGIPDPNRPEEIYQSVCLDNKPPTEPPRKCLLPRDN